MSVIEVEKLLSEMSLAAPAGADVEFDPAYSRALEEAS